MTPSVTNTPIRIACTWLIVCLIGNFSIISSSAFAVHHKNSTLAVDDILLICSGSKLKAVSLSHFESTGQFEFIELPQTAQSDEQLLSCGLTLAADNNKVTFTSTQNLIHTFLPQQQVLYSFDNPLVNVDFSYTSPARAPPLFS